MLKRIVRHGNGRAVTFDRVLLEMIGIDPNGEVEVTLQEGKLVLTAPNPETVDEERKIEEMLKKVKVYAGPIV
jgi:antitoxin component of MazEF toxin-antitoxin module